MFGEELVYREGVVRCNLVFDMILKVICKFLFFSFDLVFDI